MAENNVFDTTKTSPLTDKFFSINEPILASFLLIIDLFRTFTTWRNESSIQWWNFNSQPFDQEYPPLTN